MSLKIDSLDKRILAFLTRDARTPFLRIARKCNVSGAAIHQRVNLMISNHIVSGSQFNVDPLGLGYGTCAFIGLFINQATINTHKEVFRQISEIPEITECKIYAKNNEHLRKLITDKIQSIPEITNTETFISLEVGFQRQLPVEN
jgi:Lrp/AsnC family transcriptional regulator for asnA, asnC and gidA